MTQAGEGIIAILAWLGLCCAVGGLIYLASLYLRREFADEPLSDQAHGDWPALPEEMRWNNVEHHSGGYTR